MIRKVERIGRERASLPSPTPGVGTDGSQETVAVTVIRRLGYVAAKVHQHLMDDLIRRGDQVTAERVNNCFKPLVDMLINFSLEEETWPGVVDDE